MAHPKLITAKAIYDFSVDAGAVSTITPADTETIPANAIIVDAMTCVTTLLGNASGTPTVAIKAGGLTVIGAQDYNHASLADEKVTVNAVADKTTASGAIQVVIASAALDAGVIEIYVSYYLAGSSS